MEIPIKNGEKLMKIWYFSNFDIFWKGAKIQCFYCLRPYIEVYFKQTRYILEYVVQPELIGQDYNDNERVQNQWSSYCSG